MIEFENVESAVTAIRKFLKPGDVVLLKASRASAIGTDCGDVEVGKNLVNGNALLFQPADVGLGAWDGFGKAGSLFAPVPLHHGSRAAGAAITALVLSLWLGPKNNSLAQDFEIWPGLQSTKPRKLSRWFTWPLAS